jgi:AraC-like DNA-binding protein
MARYLNGRHSNVGHIHSIIGQAGGRMTTTAVTRRAEAIRLSISETADLENFCLGPRDERFAISPTKGSHVVELHLNEFDASSPDELGGMLVVVSTGVVTLLGPLGRWDIQAGHMVFIPPHRPYRLSATTPSHIRLVKFTTTAVRWHHHGCWAAPLSPLAREMIAFAGRWTEDRDPDDALANSFFDTLGLLMTEWFDRRRLMWAPFGRSREMRRVIAFAQQNLDTATVGEVAELVGMSERTFRRRFNEELGFSWRDFMRETRMTRAIELLVKEGRSVTQTAFDVGFNSVPAFSHAFTTYAGRPPAAYSREYNGDTQRAGQSH